MTKTPSPGERIKALRTALGNKTQREFAELLGVTQATIAAWEGGDKDYAPGPAAYLALGRLAYENHFVNDTFWFWERAGQGENMVLGAASERLRERGESAGPEPGSLVSAMMRGLPKGVEVLRLDKQPAGSAFEGGDLIIFERASGSDDLGPFWNQTVLVTFDFAADRREGFRQWWPEDDMLIGQLRLKEYMYTQFHWMAELGPIGEFQGSLPCVIGFWQYPHPPGFDKPQERNKAALEAKLQAPTKIRLTPGCRILGRAIGWFRPPAAEKSK